MTDELIEGILNDSEMVSAMLAAKGPQHMIGVLTIATAVGFKALGVGRDEAAQRVGKAVHKAFDLFEDMPQVN